MRRRHVLVVEDHEDAREAVRCLLEVRGHQVQVAADGLQAVTTALGPQPPEVVLLDIGIPGMDGYEVARHIRAAECGKGMMLVAVTGYDHSAHRDRMLESGFDAHLVKPVDPDELYRLLESS